MILKVVIEIDAERKLVLQEELLYFLQEGAPLSSLSYRLTVVK